MRSCVSGSAIARVPAGSRGNFSTVPVAASMRVEQLLGGQPLDRVMREERRVEPVVGRGQCAQLVDPAGRGSSGAAP